MDTIIKILVAWIIILVLFLGITLTYVLIDGFYVKPTADNRANEYCKSLGFDQYKTFSRVGLWSEIPIGIKCEYAEKYTDLGVRNN